ncbi:hypothetical protein RvY_08410-1 [Ramazzottius varieornatus]|uniref:Uncharacterized protein n=1 Tax=Ramazzottius varieornatus TaxID=947166 RepID=A0A1D1V5T1_RAMVA|nr:hypothetical protein RvY_08410-1 [Ramazzottius varieornatus]
MASAQSFSELLKPKQLSVLRVFFKPQSKYTVRLTRLQHDTKGLMYVITSVHLQFPHRYRAMTIDPPARIPEPEVITLSSDSEHEQENKEPIVPSPSREASTVSTVNTTRMTVQPASTAFRVDSNLSEEDEPLRKPPTLIPRRKKRVIRDSSDEETPQDESTISGEPSPGKIRQLRPVSGSSEVPSTPGTLGDCGGRTHSRPQLPLRLSTPRVSAEPSEDATEDRQREKKKVFVPGYQTLVKRGTRYLLATIQQYSSAKVGFKFHLLSITDEEFGKECFDFLLQDEYLSSENMIVNVPEDTDEDPLGTCSSNASNRSSSRGSRGSRSRPRGRKLKIGSDT